MHEPRSRIVSIAALLALLADGRPEEICATAILLGALRPRDRRVVPALGAAIQKAPNTIRPYLVEALARQGDLRAWKFLEADLLTTGVPREQAIHVLPWFGPAAIPRLKRLYPQASGGARFAFAQIYARIGDEAAIDECMALLEGDDFDLAKSVVRALREARPSWPAGLSQHLARRIREALVKDCSITSRIAMLKILAEVGTEAEWPVAIAHALPPHTMVVRYTALEALLNLPLESQPEGPTAEQQTMRNELREALDPVVRLAEDEPHAALLALRALRRLGMEAKDLQSLEASFRSPDLELQRLALRTEAELAPEAAIPRLRERLLSGREAEQEVAAQVFATTGVGLSELLALHDAEEAFPLRARIRRLVERRGAALSPVAWEEVLVRATAQGLDEAERTERIQLLAALDQGRASQALTLMAREAIATGTPLRAVALLEPLVRFRLASLDGRYTLALAHLLAARCALPPAHEKSAEDHRARAFQLFAPLARVTEFSLASVLLTEPALDEAARSEIAADFAERGEDPGRIAATLGPKPGEPPAS